MNQKFLPILFVFAVLTCVSNHLQAAEGDLTSFGVNIVVPRRQLVAASDAKTFASDSLTPAIAARWSVENPPASSKEKLFTVEEQHGKNVLVILAGELEPEKSTVRVLLPGDGPTNGDVWAKSKANVVSFLCRSDQAVKMTFHLLQRGKSAGTFRTSFSVQTGEWQPVVLHLDDFGLKSFANMAGFGFRVVTAKKEARVSIAGIRVGSIPYSDDSWKSHRLAIPLKGGWRFATDRSADGVTQKWNTDGFDDSAWPILQAGLSWQEQKISHHGFGWYRQKLFVPKELDGTPLTLTFSKNASDDDVWFNGTRIGGWQGEYKYDNHQLRTYTVPSSLIRYGTVNTIALRIWGGNLSFLGDKSGLTNGPLVAELDPYHVTMREPGGQETPAELFDLSEAQQGKPFEIVLRFPLPAAKVSEGQLSYRVADLLGNEILVGNTPLKIGPDELARAVIAVDREAAQTIYLRGRFQIRLVIVDRAGEPLYLGTKRFDQLSFKKRDESSLPALSERVEETPYGVLKLVDEIDSATPLVDDPHPYLQSGFEHAQDRVTPGSPVGVKVTEVLGRKARESDFGWFAYRIGRGKLKPHSTYLLRVEYPEDKPRYCPLEIQTGQNYMDVGWKNGIAPDNVYDNWPLSKQWQWYDIIVPLDSETVGTGGTGTASAENGFWVYFMNKVKPGAYFSNFAGGPAVGRIKLYEIDSEKHLPTIRKPQGLPQRVLSFDWERQPDHEPADLVRYAKLMGYSAISPVILKWAFANYGEPLNGYDSINIDDHNYWVTKRYDPKAGKNAEPPLPGRPSVHLKYLEATKNSGLDYVPRFEWGGSLDLPQTAWARGADGKLAKPNRFGQWCGNLLNPMTWDDLQKLMDHLIKPHVQAHPQLRGALWRIREDRMPISYGRADLELFAKETNSTLPSGSDSDLAAWASGKMKTSYDDWWHLKRAQFHQKLAKLLQSYRSDLTLYYYNWDGDKFSLIEPDLNTGAFLGQVAKQGRAAYERDAATRAKFKAEDYLQVLRTGNFGAASKGINRADYGLRPEFYQNVKGLQLFAPANYLCYADMPAYLNYFQVADGLAVSNAVSYDELASRSINPKYEGNMITPAGPAFSMSLELLSYFHGDARTLNYTAYTYGRGFAAAHRRFAQAFLALPAVAGTVVTSANRDAKIRVYPTTRGNYVGVAHRGYVSQQIAVVLPGPWKPNAVVTNLVTGEVVAAEIARGELRFKVNAGPMELNAFVVH